MARNGFPGVEIMEFQAAPSSPNLTGKYRRNGKLQSCEPCRKSHLACDHTVPVCRRCIKRRCTDQCVFHPNPLTQQVVFPLSSSYASIHGHFRPFSSSVSFAVQTCSGLTMGTAPSNPHALSAHAFGNMSDSARQPAESGAVDRALDSPVDRGLSGAGLLCVSLRGATRSDHRPSPR